MLKFGLWASLTVPRVMPLGIDNLFSGWAS
jgi:hypothetical protein